jgi:hypothetical protein
MPALVGVGVFLDNRTFEVKELLKGGAAERSGCVCVCECVCVCVREREREKDEVVVR